MDVSETVDVLFGGVVPERIDELRKAWGDRTDRVRLLATPKFLLQQRYGTIQVNEIALRQIWLTGFAAWRAVRAYSVPLALAEFHKWPFDPNKWHSIPEQRAFDQEFDRVMEAVEALSKFENFEDFDWPNSVPYPQEGLRLADPEEKGTFDLICMAGAYVFAHEIRHAIFEYNQDSPADVMAEERECDRWALGMLLDQAEKYGADHGHPPGSVTAKRVLGVVIAKLTILAITPRERWDKASDHPPVRERIKMVLDAAVDPLPDWFWMTVASMLTAFSRRSGAIPEPIAFPASFRDLAYVLCDRLRG